MQFLFPTFLFALAAIAIPIIIHLFHFRRFKKVYFTNVQFLKEVKEETSARSKLKNLLVLLCRILAIAFLVFAFAQPFIPQNDTDVKSGKKAVSIYVDNSFSMDSRSQDVPLIEKAKQRARSIISAYDVEDEFQVLTSDFEGRHQRLLSQEDALGLVDEINTTYAVKQLSKVLTKQGQVLNTANADNKVAFIISDFQKNVTDITALKDTAIEVNLLPLQSVQKRNVSVDSCWFEAPVQMLNQTNRLIVKLRNLSDVEAEDVRLNLKLDGQVKPMGNVSIPAGEEAFDTVNITITHTGWHEAELVITDFPINFDDSYYFTFNVEKEINVLTINEIGANKYISAVFGENRYFRIENQSNTKLDYSKIPDYELIVLNELKSISTGLAFELKQYIQNGGNVLIFPNAKASLNSYKSFLTSVNANELTTFETKDREVTFINTDGFVFNDVYRNTDENLKLPFTKGNFKVTRYGTRSEEVLLRYRDGGAYLSQYQYENGNLFLCAAPMDLAYNDLAQNAEIFVPMVYRMAIVTGRDHQIAYTIGKDEVLETESRVTETEMVYKLKGKTEEFIPGQKTLAAKVILNINNQINEAGFYDLFLEENKTLYKFAFNYDRRESALAYYTASELKELGGNTIGIIESQSDTAFPAVIDERNRGVTLWRTCLFLALAFLLFEILILRFWKT